MIRLYIIEDHPVIVDGIRLRIRHHQEEMSIAGWSENIENFIHSAVADSFDIIILDLWLPGSEPVENLQLIRNSFPDKPVVIFTQETSTYWIRVMMENGAKAYLVKNVDRHDFKETIENVFRGKTVAPVVLLDENATYAGNELLEQKYFLKPSERSIVVQVSNGITLKDVAEKQQTTVSAVEKTLKKIRKNFLVKTNPELIRVLVEKKLI